MIQMSILIQSSYILTIITIWLFAFNISTTAVIVFLKLCKQLLLYFGRTFDCHQLAKFGNAVPLTIKSVHRMISLKTNCFESYVVCPSCDSIYMFEDCVERTLMGHLNKSKKCRHVLFPNHPHVSQRAPYGSLLLRKVKCKRSFRLLGSTTQQDLSNIDYSTMQVGSIQYCL